MKTTITVLEMPTSYETFLVSEFTETITTAVDKIPEKYRDGARIEFDVDSYYDSASSSLTIEYDRPETSGEKSGRLARDKAINELAERRDRANLAALKAKYGE